MPRSLSSVTLEEARQLISGAEAKARDLGVAYNLAVVHAGGNLVAHVRMDGAWLGSIEDQQVAEAAVAAFGKQK
jgi:uncharacterized protein GlcG (DUF336 family)